MGARHERANAVGRRDPANLQRLFETLGPVIQTGKDMGMQVDHEVCRFLWNCWVVKPMGGNSFQAFGI